MEQNVDNKIDIKNRFINFYNNNTRKIYFFICLLIIIFASISFFNIKSENKNILIAEKYVKAGLYLASGDKDKSINLLDEIILSKNSFYGILALNLILEKNLVLDKNKIINYFEILNNTNQSKGNKDIINLKKALFLLKNSDFDQGNELLDKMIKENSDLKSLAEEIIIK